MKKLILYLIIAFANPQFIISQISDWTCIGPFERPAHGAGLYDGIGRVSSVRFGSDFSTTGNFYVGTPMGGLWVWEDNLSNWKLLNTDKLPHIGVSDEIIDPQNSQHILVATGDGDLTYDGGSPGLGSSSDQSRGIYETMDGGFTWSSNSVGVWYDISNTPDANFWDFPSHKAIKRLLMNPTNNNELICIISSFNVPLAATESFIYKSIDNGQNWFIKKQIANESLFDLEFKPADPTVVYASGKGLYKSTNSGDSWNSIGTTVGFSRIEIGVTPDDSTAIYYLEVTNSFNEDLKVSFDQGVTFSLAATIVGQLRGNRKALAIDPNNKFNVFCSDLNNYITQIVSTDLGLTWNANPFTGSTHADIHDLTFGPMQSTLYASTDGGLYTTSDNGLTWNFRSDGMAISQVWNIGTAQSNPSVLIAGLQDNGTFLHNPAYYSTTDDWAQVAGGDGMECAIDSKNENILYRSDNQGGGVFERSDDSGLNWHSVKPSSQLCSNYKPISTSLTDPNLLFVVYHDLWTSLDKGDTWTQSSIIPNGDPNDRLFSLSVSPIDPRVIYVAYHTNSSNHLNRIYKTTDGGATWRDLGEGDATCPSNLTAIEVEGIVQAVTVDYYHPEIVYVGFWGGGAERVYKGEPMTCGALIYYNWTDYSAGLPATDVWWLTTEKGSSNLYAGTSLGVFYRNSSTNHWELFNDKLPNVRINQLSINYSSNEIFAATHGRSVWKSNLLCPTQALLTLSGNTVNDEFDEATIITSTAFVQSGYKAKYRGVDEVTLLPNFTTDLGADVDIFIHGCDHPGNSFRKNVSSPLTNQKNEKLNPTNSNFIFSIYPNPSSGKYIIEHSGNDKFSLIITNVVGNEILKTDNISISSFIDITNYPPGIYFLKIFDGKNSIVKRLIHT